jgi:hypothetical protein
MGTAIGVVVAIGVIAFLVWIMRQPSQETAMGRENRARREAKKAARSEPTDDQSED